MLSAIPRLRAVRFSVVCRPALLLILISCALVHPARSVAAGRSSGDASAVDTSDKPTAGSVPEATVELIEQSCYDCHQGEHAEAGLDLESLGDDLRDPDTLRHWVRMIDRIRDGEMPPEDYGELEPDVVNRFVGDTGAWIRRWQQAEANTLGRVRSRRLTNQQLERTLHDLLAIDRPLASLVPEEQRTDGFVGIAEQQSMSHFQLQSHLRVVDAALDAAMDRVTQSSEKTEKTFTARQIARENPRRRCRDPEMIDGLAVTWSSRLIFYGRITSSTVPESGWYRITFKASALNPPENHGVWCTVRSGKCTSGAPLLSWVGAFEATDEAKEFSYQAWIPKGHMLEIRPGDTTLKMARFQGGQVGAGEGGPQNVPGVALHQMRMERIHPGGDLNQVKQQLFGDLDVEIDHKRNSVRLRAEDPNEQIEQTGRQLQRFASQAFRRPVDAQTLQPYLEILRQSIDQGSDPIEALRAAYRAVLCSPRFLYLTEQPGALDGHAIASRLSYFLTGSMPDEQLRRLAESGQLSRPEVLLEQTDRLLEGEGLRDFVRDFTAQWLDLAQIDATEPDRKLYPTFDIVVQQAMLRETVRFLETLIAENRPASELVDADFTFLNSRLARFYEIDVDLDDAELGNEFERVSLDGQLTRGGLLTHGSILKVTANGTNTSPVVRGVWVSERILGERIPPPPENVPAIEPDVRGAETIREMLEKHRSDAACASCHRKIDPPGFALENFDPAGRWRDEYRQGRKRLPIDAGYQLPDGRRFEDFAEFRELIAADPRPIARNFAGQLVVYATGGEITFSDRQVLDEIVEKAEATDYGMRSIIDAVVLSPLFLNK